MKDQDFNEQKARERTLELTEFVEKRSNGSTRILAVTKGFPKEAVAAAYGTGITLFGENYAQELIEKHNTLNDL